MCKPLTRGCRGGVTAPGAGSNPLTHPIDHASLGAATRQVNRTRMWPQDVTRADALPVTAPEKRSGALRTGCPGAPSIFDESLAEIFDGVAREGWSETACTRTGLRHVRP